MVEITSIQFFSFIFIIAFIIYICREFCGCCYCEIYEEDVFGTDINELELALQEQLWQDIVRQQHKPPAFWSVTIDRRLNEDRFTRELINTEIDKTGLIRPDGPNYTFITLPDNTIQLALVEEQETEFVPIELLERETEEETEREEIPLPGQVIESI